ncbi:RTA1 domain protein [Rutstroemia sp. NJR-2017a BBW]|nr:RTA1 domain protein [Rutstroemia sp. NJR-2017a BBW]
MDMEDGQPVPGSYYFYAPNKVAPVVFAVLVAISMVVHGYQCHRYKCWKVTGFLPWSACIYLSGFILREIGAFNYDNLPIYIASLVMLYAAPPIYELVNYFILSRILYYVPYHSPLHPGRVLTTFGALSAVVEALNANGASRVANSSLPAAAQETGKSLLKAALVLQLVILGCFILLAATFNRKCYKNNILPANLQAVLTTLYISSALIGTRTIYRTVEYFSTASIHISPSLRISDISPILRYEWFFWVFEASLMLCNTCLLNIRHPMRYLPRNNKIYLGTDGTTEIEGTGYEDKRFWLWTVLDPFDLVGAFKGRNVRREFWENGEGNRAAGGNSNETEAQPAVVGDAGRNTGKVA